MAYTNIYYQNNCDNNIPGVDCDPCSDKEKARVRSTGFLHKSFAFTDPTDNAEYEQAVLDGKLYILPRTAGKITPEPIMEKGYGDEEEVLVGYKYKAEIEEPNYKGNALFWNSIKNSKNFKAIFRTETQVHISDTVVSIKPKAPVEDDINKNIVWMIEITWTQEDLLLPHDAPQGIFDDCFQPA